MCFSLKNLSPFPFHYTASSSLFELLHSDLHVVEAGFLKTKQNKTFCFWWILALLSILCCKNQCCIKCPVCAPLWSCAMSLSAEELGVELPASNGKYALELRQTLQQYTRVPVSPYAQYHWLSKPSHVYQSDRWTLYLIVSICWISCILPCSNLWFYVENVF